MISNGQHYIHHYFSSLLELSLLFYMLLLLLAFFLIWCLLHHSNSGEDQGVGFWGGTKLAQWTPKMVVDTYQETLKPKYTIGPYNLAHEQF